MDFLKMTKLDIITTKSQYASYLSLAFMLLFLGLMGSSSMWLGINSAWFMALMACNVFAVQEKNNLDRFYGAVSLKFPHIVQGRYFYLCLAFMVSYLAVILISLVFSLVQNKPFDIWEAALGFCLSFLVFSAIIGIQVPMLFRMGYTKARAWALVPYLIILGLVMAPFLYGAIDFDLPALTSALNDIRQFIQHHKVGVFTVGILASCALQYFSYKASVAAYRKRR